MKIIRKSKLKRVKKCKILINLKINKFNNKKLFNQNQKTVNNK